MRRQDVKINHFNCPFFQAFHPSFLKSNQRLDFFGVDMGLLNIEKMYIAIKEPPLYCLICSGELKPFVPSLFNKMIIPYYFNSKKYQFYCCAACLKEYKVLKAQINYH
jgi:hypothetical protein